MLAGRGEVYAKDTVRFASHDDCGCAGAPAFGEGRPLEVHQYIASKRNQTEADRRRVREYLASMDADAQSSTATRMGEPAKPVSKRTNGFDAMSRQQVEKQISILEGLKDSDYKTAQLGKLRDRLGSLPN